MTHFNDATDNWLFFKVGNTTSGDWGETRGNWLNSSNNGNLPDTYDITISNNVDQNGSNLVKMITLCHELIHAYMLDTLSDAGVITFDSNGKPKLNVSCSGTNYNNFDLNSASISDRFTVLMCAMDATNTLSDQWAHDLFSTTTFSVTTYQQQLSDYILNNHDWDSEPTSFKNDMISLFGSSDWKQKTAEACSWIGLTQTSEYQNYINNLPDPSEASGIIEIAQDYNYINDANSNCN